MDSSIVASMQQNRVDERFVVENVGKCGDALYMSGVRSSATDVLSRRNGSDINEKLEVRC